MGRSSSQLNRCRIFAAVAVASLLQYTLLSLVLFSRVHPALYQSTIASAGHQRPAAALAPFACHECSPFHILDTAMFSCVTCNSTAPPPARVACDLAKLEEEVVHDETARPLRIDTYASRLAKRAETYKCDIVGANDSLPPPASYLVHLAKRAAIDTYYNNDTWLMHSSYCSAWDARNCPTMLPDALLGYLLDVPLLSVHPAVLVCALLLVVVTCVEVAFVLEQVRLARVRRSMAIAVAMLANTVQPVEEDEVQVLDPLFDAASLFGPRQRPAAALLPSS